MMHGQKSINFFVFGGYKEIATNLSQHNGMNYIK